MLVQQALEGLAHDDLQHWPAVNHIQEYRVVERGKCGLKRNRDEREKIYRASPMGGLILSPNIWAQSRGVCLFGIELP